MKEAMTELLNLLQCLYGNTQLKKLILTCDTGQTSNNSSTRGAKTYASNVRDTQNIDLGSLCSNID